MIKYHREFRRVHKSIWGALALLILLGFLLQNVAGSVYYAFGDGAHHDGYVSASGASGWYGWN